MSQIKPGTPLPWRFNANKTIIISDSPNMALPGVPTQVVNLKGAMGGNDTDADSAYIVHAANAFPALEVRVKMLEENLKKVLDWADETGIADDEPPVYLFARVALKGAKS